jgi:anti-sigma-K factor RskA
LDLRQTQDRLEKDREILMKEYITNENEEEEKKAMEEEDRIMEEDSEVLEIVARHEERLSAVLNV